MDRRCGSPCAWLVMVLALLTHVAELVFSSLLAYALYRDVTQRDVFFSLTAGVVILPLVLVQLLSALFLLRRRGDSMRGGEAAGMGVLHVLQLAFLWRHLALIRKPALLHKHELRELFVLRLTFTFAGGFPLLLIQTYLLLGTRAALVWPWAAHASLAATALSVTFTLTSAQRVLQEEGQGQGQGQDVPLCSWPAWLFTCVWRVGEVVSRTVCLALFAALYHQWVLLVLGLHWLVMLLCLSLPQSSAAGSGSSTSSSSARRVAVCVVTSYSYVWCYVSLSDVRAAVWYTVYYVIMFLENCTLGIVWLTKTEEQSFTARYLWVLVSTLAFLVSTACLLVIYRHFHLLPPPLTPSPSLATSPSPPQSKDCSCPCPTCCHAAKKQYQQHYCTQRQPGVPSEWSGQYGSALLTDQYYKHHLHDSLLDSASERNSAPPGWSHHHAALQGQGERCACAWRGEGDGVSVVSCQTSRSASSCPHHHHHPHHHRRHRGGVAGTTKTSRSDITDSTSVLTLASGASHNLGYEGSDDTQSNTVPAWLPTGESLIAKHLMIADMAGPGVAPPPDPDKEWTQRQKRCMERYRCLLKQEAERWGSEGYPPSHHHPHHPGVPDWPKVSRAALTTSPTWDLPPGEPPCCQGCSCGHHSHLSPGDSEVSSIFRATHLHPPCCDREGGGGDAGLGRIPGHLPPHHHHHHHRHQHCKDSPSSSSSDSEDSEITCPCCQKQQQHPHPHHHPHHHQQQQQGRQYHSQPSIFTLSPQDPPCCRPGRREPAHDKRCVSDSEGLRRKQHQGGGLKKAKHPDKRRPRDHSTGRTRKRDAASPARTTPLERRQHEPAPGNVAEVKDQAAPRHVPSKLQVKAIAEKSDEDGLPISSTSPRSPEPIYENMVVCLEENNQPCVEQNNQKKSTSSHQTSQYAVNKDEDTLKICRDNKVYMNTTTQESAHTKHTTSTTKHQGKNNKEDIFISDSFVSDSTRRKDHHHKDKKAAKRDASPAKTVHERNSADREKLEEEGNQKRWGGSGADKPQRRRGGGVPGVGMGKEAWYMCSESEDSALPPETFSSSGLEEEEGGGMTASDLDSDISFELII